MQKRKTYGGEDRGKGVEMKDGDMVQLANDIA
jgi:hypothetical protein